MKKSEKGNKLLKNSDKLVKRKLAKREKKWQKKTKCYKLVKKSKKKWKKSDKLVAKMTKSNKKWRKKKLQKWKKKSQTCEKKWKKVTN